MKSKLLALGLILTMLVIAAPSPDRGSWSLGSEPDILVPSSDCLPINPPPPVVKIKVRVPACSNPGDMIEYCVCVENCSKAEAHHVVVKNVLPANAKFIKSDPAPTKQGTELQWELGTIGGGATREIRLFLAPTNTEDVKNCVRVQFEHGQCVVTRQALHQPGMPYMPPIPGDPSVKPPTITPVPEIPPEGLPVLELKIDGKEKQFVNMDSKYFITLTNKGKGKATGVLVNCRLADKLKIKGLSAPGVIVENEGAWYLGSLEPGATRVLDVTLRATEKGEHCFKAMVQADLGIKKEASFCTQFTGLSAMTIEMFDRDDPVFLGYKTSYPIIIRSQGSDSLTNVRVKAFIPEGLKLVRANAKYDAQPPVKEGQWIEFMPLPRIDGGDQARYEVFVEATQAGVTRFQIQVTADQLDSGLPVIEQELTHIVDDRELLPAKKLSLRRGSDPLE